MPHRLKYQIPQLGCTKKATSYLITLLTWRSQHQQRGGRVPHRRTGFRKLSNKGGSGPLTWLQQWLLGEGEPDCGGGGVLKLRNDVQQVVGFMWETSSRSSSTAGQSAEESYAMLETAETKKHLMAYCSCNCRVKWSPPPPRGIHDLVAQSSQGVVPFWTFSEVVISVNVRVWAIKPLKCLYCHCKVNLNPF